MSIALDQKAGGSWILRTSRKIARTRACVDVSVFI